jgi:plasmid stabilization system protein ParE
LIELTVLLAAESDIQAAYNRFEEYQEGFGLKFIQDLELAYEYLRHHPRMGRLYKSNQHRFLLSSYPFGIFYAVEGNRIVISAVLDLRQDPEMIRRRLEEYG